MSIDRYTDLATENQWLTEYEQISDTFHHNYLTQGKEHAITTATASLKSLGFDPDEISDEIDTLLTEVGD